MSTWTLGDWVGNAALVLAGILLLYLLYRQAQRLIRDWRAVGGSMVSVLTVGFVGALFIAIGLVVAFFVVQFVQWFFAFWPPLATVLTWLTWALGVIVPGIMAAEVCDAGK